MVATRIERLGKNKYECESPPPPDSVFEKKVGFSLVFNLKLEATQVH
jgi:hypothetical protein